jgi:hypothetical protein
MKDKTKELKKLMWDFEEQYDRVGVLKDVYKGETAYICTSGPTFNQFSTDNLKSLLNDKLVLSIKQTQHIIDEITDFHLLNFCNLTQYNYKNQDTIVGWAVWDESQPYTIIDNFPVDFILDTYKLNDGVPKIENTMSHSDYWEGLDINKGFSRPWGPGTMYELAIPLALYMGCDKIVTIGWDLFKNTINSGQKQDDWFYDDIEYKNTKTLAGLNEHLMVAKKTKGLYEYLESRGVELTIVDPDGDNPAYDKIKRVKDINDIK